MYLYYISPYVSIPFLAEGSRLDLKTSNLLEIQLWFHEHKNHIHDKNLALEDKEWMSW